MVDIRGAHCLVNLFDGLGQRLFGQAVLLGGLGHREGDGGRDRSQVRHWWQ
jgi:hypothetical protein